ncbi:MAG: RHS repeat-associated core domain-containing protein [Acidobacteriota bacterium]
MDEYQAVGVLIDASAEPADECPLSASVSYPVPDVEFFGIYEHASTLHCAEGPEWLGLSTESDFVQSAALTPAPGDIVTSLTFHESGNGRGQPHFVTKATGTGSDAITVELTYASGALESQEVIGLSPPWKSFDAEIDANTGRVSRTRDPAGAFTDYAFDALGRLTLVAPRDLASTTYTYPTPSTVSVVLQEEGDESEDHYSFDGFGRLTAHERLLPDGTWAFKTTAYDSSARIVKEGRWQRSGAPAPFCGLPEPTSSVLTDYTYTTADGAHLFEDPLGRIRRIEEGPETVTTYSYPLAGGVRAVQSGLNGDPTAEVSSLAVSNGLGQLVSVTPDLSGGAAAKYEYDVFGELSLARLTGMADGTSFVQTRSFVRDGHGRVIASADPESGLTENLEFDLQGNVTRLRDENGRAASYTIVRSHDQAGRLLSVAEDHGASTHVLYEYRYDGDGSPCPGTHDLGKLTSEIVPLPGWGGSYQRCVRHSGLAGLPDHVRVDLTTETTGTASFESTMDYNRRGQVAVESYPDGHSCTEPSGCTSFPAGVSMAHSYQRGQPRASVYNGLDDIQVTKWAANLQPIEHHVGDGTRRLVELDDQDRITRMSVIDGAGAALWDSGTHVYDGLSNISSIGVEGVVGTHPQSYTYDSHGRLTKAVLAGSVISYLYDDFGNMTDRLGSPFPAIGEGGFTGHRHHDGGTHTNRISGPGWLYDGNGNLTLSPEPAQSYSWDVLNRLDSIADTGGVTIQRHAYDSTGERFLRENANELRFYYRAGGARTLAEFTWSGTGWLLEREYLKSPLGEFGFCQHESGVFCGATYTHADHVGTPRLETDRLGNVTALRQLSPFGLPVGSGGASTHVFTGHERDIETSLDYMHARYFGVRHARFLSRDPLDSSAEAQDTASWNRYSYVTNNPLTFVDPDGLKKAMYVMQTTGWWEEVPVNKMQIPSDWSLSYDDSASKKDIEGTLKKADRGDIVVILGHSNEHSQKGIVGMATDELIGSENISGQEMGKAAADGSPPMAVILAGCQTDCLAADVNAASGATSFGTTADLPLRLASPATKAVASTLASGGSVGQAKQAGDAKLPAPTVEWRVHQ